MGQIDDIMQVASSFPYTPKGYRL